LARATDPGSPGNLKFTFTGEHTLKLAFPEGRPVLAIGPKTFAAEGVRTVEDKVALSLAFNSCMLADKAPFGSVAAGSSIAFSLNAATGVSAATLVIEKRTLEGNQEKLEYSQAQRIAMRKTGGAEGERWSASHRFDEASVYGYYFEVVIAGQAYVYQNNRNPVYWTREKGSNGRGQVQFLPTISRTIRRFRQTVHMADFRVPAWARDAVYYYIFPERFRNGDKRNDPKPGVDTYHDTGIEFHTNWLDQPYRPGSGDGSDKFSNNDFFGGELEGVISKLDYIRDLGANTIYMTPLFRAASNHKYDTGDYRNIDPAFGSNADFVRLTREAARRGIRVIADASFNHTGSDSQYFDRYAKYPTAGAFESGRINVASPCASWYTFDRAQNEPDKQYTGWGGVADLPELNKAAPDFRRFAFGASDSITHLWLNRGAAGWRMDVAPWVPDDFWRAWRKQVKAHRPEALTVAETWFDSSKYLLGDTFDTTMNYIFRNAVLDYAAGGKAGDMVENLELMREAYPPQSLYAMMNLLSTHDQARSLHVLGEPGAEPHAAPTKLAKRRYRLALLFQMMFPGSPAVYYGDEVGVSGGDDPANRATYPWADLGGKPDLTMLAEFKKLITLRKQNKVLRHGSIDAPLHVDDHVVVMARRDGGSWAIFASNNSDALRTVTVSMPSGVPQQFGDALGGSAARVKSGKLTLNVPPMYGVALIGKRSK